MAPRTHRVTVRDVVVGSGDAAVEAYVVEPAAGEPRAGILFLHWLGEHRSDRSQFLAEARRYGALGVRCVLPAGRLPWVPDPIDAETDIADSSRTAAARRSPRCACRRAPRPRPDCARRARLRGDAWPAARGPRAGLRGGGPDRRHAALGRLVPAFLEGQGRPVRLPSPAGAPRSDRSGGFPDRANALAVQHGDFFIAPMSAVELARIAPADGEPRIEWYTADHAMRSAKARAARQAVPHDDARARLNPRFTTMSRECVRAGARLRLQNGWRGARRRAVGSTPMRSRQRNRHRRPPTE